MGSEIGHSNRSLKGSGWSGNNIEPLISPMVSLDNDIVLPTRVATLTQTRNGNQAGCLFSSENQHKSI